jgi:hypothetical protein
MYQISLLSQKLYFHMLHKVNYIFILLNEVAQKLRSKIGGIVVLDSNTSKQRVVRVTKTSKKIRVEINYA